VESLVAVGLPFVPPLMVIVAGVLLVRQRPDLRSLGIAITVVGAIALLLVMVGTVWMLTTFDPS
jgi:hypothetical protein